MRHFFDFSTLTLHAFDFSLTSLVHALDNYGQHISYTYLILCIIMSLTICHLVYSYLILGRVMLSWGSSALGGWNSTPKGVKRRIYFEC